ncbi:hypothetical protein [Nostoc sp. 2RC]|uniref:hypothetical protein n=1 Tax=Nostoc sp. 2RC TaxID=2485484 RepID=UPI0016245F36|nr:hypothetical protein [Nostoc sp. 2RC]MBC1235725.1 hypothetical protein [Nostoc sp. 2RC]
MVPLKWVDATDLVRWADRLDARARLPQVLRLLIHATVQHPRPRRVDFPSGESIQMPGWDGIVDAPKGNSFVPDGYSVWELGVNKDFKGKADGDYTKRVKNPLGVVTAETTFVFVTPRRWVNKNEWERDKKSEGIWADVKAYDADDLEQWLEQAPAVHARLAWLMRKWLQEAQDIGSFWYEWKNSTSPPMNTQLHLAGREKEVERVHNWLQAEPSKLTIQADTREEVIAILGAVIHQMPEAQNVEYLSRCIIVQSEPSWRYFASTQESLILIPTFEQPKFLPREHHILIPIGREIKLPEDGLKLLRPDKTAFRQALVDMGLSEERAYNLIKNSKRNLNVLRRLIAVAPEIHTPDWAKPENARSLIPILLAGAWDDTKQGDREVIAKLARKPYEEVVAEISRWLNSSDPPVRQIGSVWQLISREDSWHLLSRFIIRDDLEAFTSVTLSILGSLDPRFELPLGQRYAASIYGKELANSDFLREGLAETLAILATRGLPSETQDIISAQERVTGIIHSLLNSNVDWRIWASLAYFLPTLAEAAPEAFLEAVDNRLVEDNPTLVQLFLQEESFGGSPHTGLLWALEVLVWEAQYLSQVTLILGKLSRLDPGGKIINRPFSSLCEIFLCWNPQTSANSTQRLRVIDTLIAREPDIGWQLLCNLLPQICGETSDPIYQPRWRDWNADSTPKVTCTEYWNNIDALVERVLSNMGSDSEKICAVIKKIEFLPPQLQDKSVNHLLAVDIINIKKEDLVKICEIIREIIQAHKEFSDAESALSADAIDKFYLLHRRFEPKDIIYRYAWLFSFNPNFLYRLHKEHIYNDWETRSKKIKEAQTSAARKIYFQADISAVLEMAEVVKEPVLLGAAIASIETISGEAEISFISETIGNEKEKLNVLAIGFIRSRLENCGWDWVANILSCAKNNHWTEHKVINVFYALPFEKRSWDLLISFGEKLTNIYWQTIPAGWVKENEQGAAIIKLLEFNRPYAALNLVNLYQNDKNKFLPSTLLVDILEKAASVDPYKEQPQFNTSYISYRIGKVFDILEILDNIEYNKLAFLEWIYLPLLVHSQRQPKLLYQELCKDPLFFVQILKFVYQSEDDRDESVEIDQATLNRANLGSKLLKSWHQVPGLKEDGTVDIEQLRNWVLRARTASQESGRGKIADVKIGHVLAYAPKSSDGIWPDIAVREIIEEVASKHMEQGITTGVFNKRGMWWKSMGKGGVQERELAETYRNYAITVRDTHPRTAAMLRRIADSYIFNAHWEDIQTELED